LIYRLFDRVSALEDLPILEILKYFLTTSTRAHAAS
jgi:hypothetical protein